MTKEEALDIIANIIDDVAVGYLRAALEEVRDKFEAENLMGQVYEDYMTPITEIRKYFDYLDLLTQYVKALGGIRTDILPEIETNKILDYINTVDDNNNLN